MEERTWSRLRGNEAKGKKDSIPQCIWDSGNEQWELYENGELRHYKILHREFIDSDRVREVLERMEESAIPAEIFAKHKRDTLQWTLEKKQVHTYTASNAAVWELIPLSDWIPVNALLQTNAIRQ
jgi:hypothetical protein